MNVARAILDRLIQHQIHVTNDWRGVRLSLDILCSAAAFLAKFDYFIAQLREHVVHALRIGGVVFVDDGLDLFLRRYNDVDVAIQREAQILRDLRVERVHQCHGERIAAHAERHRAVQARETGGDQPQHFRRRLVAGQIHHVRAEHLGNALVKILVRDKPEIHQRGDDIFAGGFGFLDDVVHLAAINDSLINEKLNDLFCVHRVVGNV